MCKNVKDYLGVAREYKAELIMFAGFIIAGCLYLDLRGFITEQTRCQLETARALQEMNIRLANVEYHLSTPTAHIPHKL